MNQHLKSIINHFLCAKKFQARQFSWNSNPTILEVKILTYLTSLALSAFLYSLFSAYLTESAKLNAVLPLVSLYSTLFIFSFLSWFHFFKPKLGATLLTIFIFIRFLSWPLILFVEYFVGEYHPSLVEALVPPVLSILVILFVWKAEKQKDINKHLKIALAIPAFLIGVYATWNFTYKLFQ
jgi:hypothetical protein